MDELGTQVFFNSSFYNSKFNNRNEAALAFTLMVEGLKNAINAGAEDLLVSRSDALDVELANEYRIRDWVNDRSVVNESDGSKIDIDLQRYFVRKLDKAPYFEDAEYIGSEDFQGCEVDICIGEELLKSTTATLSFLNSGIILSPPLAIFQAPFLSCKVSEIEEEYQGVLRCLFDSKSLDYHIQHIRSSSGADVLKSDDLWEHKDKLFPSLEFCGRVEKQLIGLSHYKVIYSRLNELENYAKNWTSGAFEQDKLPSKASGESETVRSNKKAIQARTFECPDGAQRTFFWHLRATPGAIRIHFFPIEEEQRIIIGHIGEKLYYNS